MSKWSAAFRDSRWQKLRLEIMERDNWTCRSCGKKEGVTLNVHHSYYEAGKAPWEYPKQTLVTFCEECHAERHNLQKHLLVCLSNVDTKYLYAIAEVIKQQPSLVSDVWLMLNHVKVPLKDLQHAIYYAKKDGCK